MKLKRWLALGLSAALVLSAVHGQYWIVSAEETGEETVTTEAENAEETAEENQPRNMEQGTEEGEISENVLSEDGEPSDSMQSAEKDQSSGNHPYAENKQGSVEKEETDTGESGVVSSEETPADTPASDPAAEEHEQDDPAADEVNAENKILNAAAEDGAGAPAAQAGDIASGTDGNINWRIDADGKLTASGTGDFTNGVPWRQYRTSIISAEINVSGMVDASEMFSGCRNLINVNLENLDTSAIEDMNRMFSIAIQQIIAHNDTNETTLNSLRGG